MRAVIEKEIALSGAATMLLMLLFLIFYSPLACYNVYRFVASSLFSCCPIILYVSGFQPGVRGPPSGPRMTLRGPLGLKGPQGVRQSVENFIKNRAVY